ncbi:MAG: TatD family hydrolase [Endomicrobiia bacterium]|nr:TatD family hydrolase [Endomicrobiia bacterium]
MTPPEIFDTHAHLLDAAYDGDRVKIIEDAARAGLFIIESALNPKEWRAAAALSATHPNLYYTLGIHPHDAARFTRLSGDGDFADLVAALKGDRCVAVGEAGLDYHYKNSPPDAQKKIFARQMDIALETGLPLVVHCREAYDDCIPMLRAVARKWRGVVHCFSGTWADAEKFMELGFLLGIDGPVTYPKSEILRDAVSRAPLDMLLTETDSPYLSPIPLRTKRNEPANVRYVAKEIARIKNISYDAASAATLSNALRLFGIPE